jgi:NTE family protein
MTVASTPPSSATGTPRRGIVLGAGGVLGAAWSIGALSAVAEVEGFDPHSAAIILGTSAGSVLAALLGAGLTVGELVDHQHGLPLPREVGLDWDYDHSTGGAHPPRPRFAVGSPALLRRTIIRPRQVPPLAVLAALAPAGTGTLAEVGRMAASVAGEGGWVQRDGVWVVAMDYDSGERTTFGREGSPPANLDDAVMASCAIPGWYAPVQIGGRRYIDGGAWSTTNVDVLATESLDEVYVLAPMAAFVDDHPHRLATRVERRVRRQVTRRLLNEAEKVTRAGAAITVLAPGPEDLATIGANMMDPARRLEVLETSLRTSADALRHPRPDDLGRAL